MRLVNAKDDTTALEPAQLDSTGFSAPARVYSGERRVRSVRMSFLRHCGCATLAALALWSATALTQPASPRVVAIGDVHASAAPFVEILQAAGLVNAGLTWIGGRAHFVQTGDVLDRGRDVRAVLDLLMRLERDASRAGGRAEMLLGNHEGMNLLSDFRDVSPDAFATFADARSERRRARAFDDHAAIAKRRGSALDRDAWMRAHPPGFVEYADAFRPSGRYGRWLRSRKVVAQVNDTVFMHAGIARATTESPIEEVNRAVERELRGWDETVAAMQRAGLITPYFTLQEIVAAAFAELQRLADAQRTNQELDPYVTRYYVEGLQRLGTIDTWALLAPDGPLWYRGYATGGLEVQTQVESLLQRLGTTRFVVGHTVQQGGRVTSRFGGRVLLIDTGMVFSGGRASALELQDGKLTGIYDDGRKPIEQLQ